MEKVSHGYNNHIPCLNSPNMVGFTMKTLQNFTKSSLPILGAVFGGAALDQVTRQILDNSTGIDISIIPASLSASFGAILVYKEIQRELAKNSPQIGGPV